MENSNESRSKAADQGKVVAQLNLGMAYDTGTGVPQNYAEAYFWLDIAAAAGETEAEGVKQQDIAKHCDQVAPI